MGTVPVIKVLGSPSWVPLLKCDHSVQASSPGYVYMTPMGTEADTPL